VTQGRGARLLGVADGAPGRRVTDLLLVEIQAARGAEQMVRSGTAGQSRMATSRLREETADARREASCCGTGA